MDTALIMTATITPPSNAPGLARTDPKQRLADYFNALAHYIGAFAGPRNRILFVDNSASDCTALVDLASSMGASSRVQIISYAGLDYPPNYGRCYGELRLLDHVMSLPETRGLASQTVFWKVTGRYKVMNLGSLTRRRPGGLDLYADLRSGKTPWLDMRVMSWTALGYERALRGLGESIREDLNAGRPGEESAALCIERRLQGIRSQMHLNTEPKVDGIRAFDNKNWSEGRQRWVYLLRQAQRRMLNRVVI